MRVSLGFVSVATSYVDRLEPIRTLVWSILFLLLAAQLTFQILLFRFVATSLWFWSGIQMISFLWLSAQLRKRRSLRWRAAHTLQSLREPGVFFVSRWIRALVTFREFSSLIVWWAVSALLIYLFSGDSLCHFPIGCFGGVLEKADRDSFISLWQVHATVLGVFLVLLTFVFQFISLRSAYETSLLPFLASKARLAPIIIVNFIFVTIEMFPVLLEKGSKFQPILRYLAVVGFAFSVLSACYLLLRVLDFLKPEMLESGLSELVREDLIAEFEEEQLLGAAGNVLSEECSMNAMEFSELDLFPQIPSVRSQSLGKIVDVDLIRLRKFSRHLKSTLGTTVSPSRRALVFRMIGDDLTVTHNVLGRVARSDLNSTTERLLRRSFKVEET